MFKIFKFKRANFPKKNSRFLNDKTKLLLGFFLLFSSLIVTSQFLKVRTYEVLLENVHCADNLQIRQRLGIAGKYIFLVDKNELLNSLQKEFVCIKDLNFSKTTVNQFEVKVAGRIPKVIIKKIYPLEATPSTQSATDSAKYLADETGLIFSKLDEDKPNLIEIGAVSDNLNIGYKFPENLYEFISQVLQKVTEYSLPSTIFKLDGDSLFVETQPRIILNLKEDLNKQIASLQLILQKAKMNSDSASKKDVKTIEMIDLRFNKPVIGYSIKK